MTAEQAVAEYYDAWRTRRDDAILARRRHDAAPVAARHEREPAVVRRGLATPGDTVGSVAIDVVTDTEIGRPRAEVADYAANPDHAPRWYENIRSVEWKSPRPLKVGSRVAFVAQFLGRRLEYTYEIRELIPGERLVMSTEQGPFPMETSYVWEDLPGGRTRMTLRNRGEPAGVLKVAAPFVARAVRRANRKDLAQLKEILEERQRPTASGGPKRGISAD